MNVCCVVLQVTQYTLADSDVVSVCRAVFKEVYNQVRELFVAICFHNVITLVCVLLAVTVSAVPPEKVGLRDA